MMIAQQHVRIIKVFGAGCSVYVTSAQNLFLDVLFLQLKQSLLLV